MSTVTNVQRGAQGFALLRRQTDESRESTPRQGKALRSAFHLCRVGTSQDCFDARRVIAISEKVGSAESGAKPLSQRHCPIGRCPQALQSRRAFPSDPAIASDLVFQPNEGCAQLCALPSPLARERTRTAARVLGRDEVHARSAGSELANAMGRPAGRNVVSFPS